MTKSKSLPMVVALDIGGSKIRGALVDSQGGWLHEQQEAVFLDAGVEGLVQQIYRFVVHLQPKEPKEKNQPILGVGLGCAGPLNPHTGELLDPTNFFTQGKSWGKVNLLQPLRKLLPQTPLFLENDAAAAVLGEAWLGGYHDDPHRRGECSEEPQNLLVMTLGTGVGVGVICNGTLVRSAEGLHPESSHIPLVYNDQSAPCGCGQWGCVEAYLSGRHFVERLSRRWQEPQLTGADLLRRATQGDQPVLLALEEYGSLLAEALRAYAVLYGPQHVILTGGFSALAPWFLPMVQKTLPQLLLRRRAGVDLLPQVQVSRLGDRLGVMGAARVAFLAGE